MESKKFWSKEYQMSRFWHNNAELYDEITTKALPDEWKDKVESGEVDIYDVPEDIRFKAACEGEEDFWASQVDEAMMRMKEEKEDKLLKTI